MHFLIVKTASPGVQESEVEGWLLKRALGSR